LTISFGCDNNLSREEMFRINTTSRNIEGEKETVDYLHTHLRKAFRYFKDIIGINASLHKEGGKFRAELTLKGEGFSLHANEANRKDISLAIDGAINKLKQQLKRHKEKIRGKKRRSHHSSKSSVSLEEIKYSRVKEGPISLEEAIRQLSLNNEPFLAFINSASNELNVLYKREEGGYGLIHP
jgi:putative sigma-54 modulation protein